SGPQLRLPIDLIVGPAVGNRHVLALDVAGLLQTQAKCAQTVRLRIRRCGGEETNHRHRWLLRARRERPRSRAAEQCYELAPFYLIELHSVPAQSGPHCRLPK